MSDSANPEPGLVEAGAPNSAEGRARGRTGRTWRSLVAAAVLGLGFAWILHRGALPIVPDDQAFSRVRWWVIPLYAALWGLVLLARSARWYWLLAPVCRVPMVRVLRVSFIGLLGLSVLPLRMGELVRPTLIRKRGKLSWWAASGTVGAERVCDGLLLSVLLFLGLLMAPPLDPLPDRIGRLPVPVAVVPAAAYGALLVFAGSFVTLAVFYWRRAWVKPAIDRTVGKLSPRVAQLLTAAVERFADGLGFLPRARYAMPFLALTLAYWLLNLAGIALLVWGSGIEGISLARAAVVMGVLSLGIIVPSAPGFFGAFQLSLYAGLAMYLPPEQVIGAGSAFVFLLYVLQLGLTILVGAVALLLEHLGADRVE